MGSKYYNTDGKGVWTASGIKLKINLIGHILQEYFGEIMNFSLNSRGSLTHTSIMTPYIYIYIY